MVFAYIEKFQKSDFERNCIIIDENGSRRACGELMNHPVYVGVEVITNK